MNFVHVAIQPWMVLVLAVAVFCIGLTGVILRKNLIIMFMGIELMLNSANLSFVAFSRFHQNIDGEMAAIFVMAVAAAESAVGLGLIIAMFRTLKTTSTEHIEMLRD